MKQPLKWDPAKEELLGDNAIVANRGIAREQRRPSNYDFIA